jgi:hypothetical protein
VQALAAGFGAEGADQGLVAVDDARNLETGRAQQPDILAHGTIDRDHDLGAEETIRAGAPIRRIVDIVAKIVAIADASPGEPERRARLVHVDHRQPVRDHCPAADVAEERIIVLLVGAEVRAGLLYLVQVPADKPHVVDDRGAVAEQEIEQG